MKNTQNTSPAALKAASDNNHNGSRLAIIIAQVVAAIIGLIARRGRTQPADASPTQSVGPAVDTTATRGLREGNVMVARTQIRTARSSRTKSTIGGSYHG